ncbi:polymerase [Limosilactobacillus fermentum]|uniref:polymerase n=1 Tax=Limosilactobacillus fermentum TaxID=1613 RepID=UPI002F26A447
MMRSYVKRLINAPITGEQVYLVTFSFMLFISFLMTTTFTDYFHTRPLQLISYAGVGLLVLKIYLFDHHDATKLIVITLLLGVAFLSWRKSQSYLILDMMALILGAKGVHFRKIIKWYYQIGLIMLIAVILYSLMGVITNLAYVVQDRGIRYALGIVYPTDLASHVLYLMAAKSYLDFKKLCWKHYVFFLVMALLMWQVANARLSTITAIILVVCLIIAKKAQNGNRFAQQTASLYWIFTPILIFVDIMATLNYDPMNQLFIKANSIFSNRLALSSEALQKYGVNLWGNHVIEHGWGGAKGLKMADINALKYFYIDSSYIRLLIIYGVVALILITVIMMCISLRATVEHDYALVTVMLVVTLSCLVEQHLLDISFNPFLLAAFTITWPRKKESLNA